MSPSLLDVTICLPSGEKAALNTGSRWPVNRRTSNPVAVSHTRAVSAELAVRTYLPVGENSPCWIGPLWPTSSRRSWPVAASHRWALPSSPPDKIRRLSGETATLRTNDFPTNFRSGDVPLGCHISEVVLLTITIYIPSGE